MAKKNLYISIFILFLACTTAFGQTETRPRPFELGVYAGPSLNWMRSTTDGYNNKGVSFGGSYGLNMEINLFQASSNYYFHTGINIRHLGSKLTYHDNYIASGSSDTVFTPFTTRYSMTYVSIPTAIKLQTNPFNDHYIIYSIFGLDNSIRVAASRRETPKAAEATLNPKNNSENTTFFREALIIAIGAEYIIHNNTRVTAGLLFNNGFTPLFNKNYYDANEYINNGKKERVNVQNRTIELQVGLIF